MINCEINGCRATDTAWLKVGRKMYFKQTNKTAVRSQYMIAGALLSLMKRKPFQQITVTEICQEAAIGRKTFYRNFELKEDVLDFYLDYLCGIFEKENLGKTTDEQLYLYFAFSRQNIEFFSAMNQNGLLPLCQRKFSRFLPEAMPVWSEDEVQQEYYSRYMTAGVEVIMQVWVEHSFREDIETVVSLAQQIQKHHGKI